MRKIGIVCAALGALISSGLLALQHTGWYADQAALRMSEPVEWIRSGFWAGVVLGVLGILLVGCSFRTAPEPEAEEEGPWEEETLPAEPIEPPAAPAQQTSWQCPWCGRVWDDNASVCLDCGYQRYG